jgi:hypothetical protein
MTSLNGRTTQFLTEDIIDSNQLESVVESLAYMLVKISPQADLNQVIGDLEKLEDVYVFAKDEIPDNLRFRENDKLLDILIKSNGNTMLFGNDNEVDIFVPDAVPGGSDYLGKNYTQNTCYVS